MRLSKAIVACVCAGMVIAGLVTASVAPASPAQADSAPVNPAQFYYVQPNWANEVVVNGFLDTYAYQEGYAASLGSPSTASVIALDFGRQCSHAPGSNTTAWGIATKSTSCPTGYQSDLWAIERAEEFESGYSAGHSSASVIVVGTSNDLDPVNCPATGSPDPLWQAAGVDWGQNVAAIAANEPSMVVTVGGNDIEAWEDQNPPTPSPTWFACGQGTENWLSGYGSSTSIENYDYGNQTNYLNPTYWSGDQLYQVSYGQAVARSLPEIYRCANADQWVQFREGLLGTPTPPAYAFDGVTSSNGTAIACPDGGNYLDWSESWTALSYGLVNATPTPFPSDLRSDSTAADLAEPTTGPSPTPTPTP